MKEYKVLSQDGAYFGGKFSPEKLQETLDMFAYEGWVVVTSAVTDVQGLVSKDQLIIILERELILGQENSNKPDFSKLI